MSYCRWSTDDFACDLYAYESGTGFVIHVAGNRPIGDIPKTDWDAFQAGRIDAATITAQHQAQHEWLMACDREPIALPHVGETFHEPDLTAFKARLIELREVGYCFPDDVLAAVDQEIAEGARA